MSAASAASVPTHHEPHACPGVVVFGASWAKSGDALYAESERAGAAIARAGFSIINGGYTGTMEGSAAGHAAAGGALREGVIVPSLFPQRTGGNEHLTIVTHAPTLLARIDVMAARARNFLVMPGTLGTLTELCAVWNVAYLEELGGGATRRRIFAYQRPWKRLIEACAGELGLPHEVVRHIVFVEDADDALRRIAEADAREASAEAAARGGAAAVPE